MGRNPVHCILSVPIIYGSEVEGVITITNKVKPGDLRHVADPLGRFGEDDEQLLVSLAENAGVNLNKARLYNASITDRLSGLYNARHFEIRMAERMESCERENVPLSLVIIDIDNFKKFNDAYGHKAGDMVISEIGAILRESPSGRTEDECFRYGGEEFCILMPKTTCPEAREIAETLRQQVEDLLLDWEDSKIRVTISSGVACSEVFPHPAALFEAADKALYRSKEQGRNQVTVAERETGSLVVGPYEI